MCVALLCSSFGMCLLEMATQEYPYAECTNPAQIFRKVTNGVPPAAVEKVTFPALKEFILLTIQSDPARRPEARQLLVHPFFEDVRQQIRSKGCLRMPPAAANAAAAAAVALAAAGMPAGEALVLDAAVVVGAGAAAGCLPAAPTPLSVPSGLEQLAKDEAAAEAAASAPDKAAAAQNEQLNAATWSPSHSHQVAAAAAVMAAMAAAGQQQQPPMGAAGSSNISSALTTPMHSIGPEASTSSLASNSSWGSLQQQLQAAGRARRRSAEMRRSMEGRRSTDEMSEEDVLFDAQVRQTGWMLHFGWCVYVGCQTTFIASSYDRCTHQTGHAMWGPAAVCCVLVCAHILYMLQRLAGACYWRRVTHKCGLTGCSLLLLRYCVSRCAGAYRSSR